MKIGCSGDIHAHEFTDFSVIRSVMWDENLLKFVDDTSENCIQVNSRLLDTLDTLVQARDHCLEVGIEVFVIPGDLFHKRGSVSTVVYNLTYQVIESFRQVGIEVIILAGNHDQVSNEDIPMNSLYTMKEIAKVVSFPEVYSLSDSVELLLVPFSKSKEVMLKPIQEYNHKDEVSTILVTHLGINGAYVGKTSYACKDMFSTADLEYQKFHYVVLGHYHKPQILEYNTFYTGSPLEHNFNDEGDVRGFWIIDTNKLYDIKLIPLKSPKFITINSKNYMRDMDYTGNFVRLEANSDIVEDMMENLTELNIDTTKIRLDVVKDYSEASRSEIGITKSFDEVIEIYAKEQGIQDYAIVGLEIYHEAMNT